MIDRAVGAVAHRLNQHLRLQFGVDDDLAVATTLVDVEGKPVPAARNQLVLFVTNITHDTMPRQSSVQARAGRLASSAGLAAVQTEPVNLNVFLMLASNFDPQNYLESLKILSAAVQFFQMNPVLDRTNTPELGSGLRQLAFEIHNLDTETLSQLWGALGGRYAPSILYKMRTVAIDAGALVGEQLVIRGADSAVAAGGAG